VPALERRHGLRVVADAAALDSARWTGDEALALGATSVDLDDEHAIVEADAGFAAAAVDVADVAAHIEWSIPTERPALAQGSIAGVPARLWLTDDGATLVTHAAYAADLEARLR
jgi:hypothetical protein